MAAVQEEKVPKRVRNRLAKAELWMLVAVTVQRWSDECGNTSKVTLPFEEWGSDDLFVSLARKYDLTGADLSRLLYRIAEELENRASRAGFDETWGDFDA